MNTKEYLKQAYRTEEIIKCLQNELHVIEKFNTPPLAPEKIEVITAIAKLKDMINTKIEALIETKTNIYHAINKISNIDEQLVLRMRYLEYYKWEQIAEEMNYSWTQIHRIHNNALKSIKVKEDK